MLNIAIVGYGNIGSAAREAIHVEPDMHLAGIVRREAKPVMNERVAATIGELGPVDTALLCLPTRLVPEAAAECLKAGINTVDSFDIHGEIKSLREILDAQAKAGGAVSILSAGWDPGSDSILRALFMAMAPRGITHTNFGPGVSMGHSVAARAVKGVKDAISMTIPAGESAHKRVVYISIEDGADFSQVAAAIKADSYFAHDDTRVICVEDVDELRSVGHGVHITRNGVSAGTHNQQLDFTMRINNPALTAQIMVSCARAASRQKPGCYTMIELPPVDMLPGERGAWVGRLV